MAYPSVLSTPTFMELSCSPIQYHLTLLVAPSYRGHTNVVFSVGSCCLQWDGISVSKEDTGQDTGEATGSVPPAQLLFLQGPVSGSSPCTLDSSARPLAPVIGPLSTGKSINF